MENFLLVSAILSWIAISLNLLLALVLLRRLLDIDKRNKPELFPELLEVGTKAPEFTLESLEGITLSSSDFKDQEHLMIFVSPTCDPCRKEMPNIKELLSQIEDRVGSLLISFGSKDETKNFIKEFQIQSSVLVTEHTSIFAQEYRILGTPSYYLIDKESRIKAGGVIDREWYEMTKQWITSFG